MTVYEPLKIGDRVKEPSEVHTGRIVEIRAAKKPHIDDGDEAYVRWHKSYASWLKIHNLVKAN